MHGNLEFLLVLLLVQYAKNLSLLGCLIFTGCLKISFLVAENRETREMGNLSSESKLLGSLIPGNQVSRSQAQSSSGRTVQRRRSKQCPQLPIKRGSAGFPTRTSCGMKIRRFKCGKMEGKSPSLCFISISPTPVLLLAGRELFS